MAWHWPERARPSDWVEANVIIPSNGFNPEPGPFRFSRTPYWREVIDLWDDTTVREIWVYKANQIGFTQLMMAVAAYCAKQDPGAMAMLMPDEDSVDELFAEQLIPLINQSPELRKLKTGRAWDETSHEIRLSTMPILGIYSGSSSKLEKRTFRYVIGDEINLYKDLPGEASAISRSLKRVSNWKHRSKAIFGSKPTTTEGAITKGYESCPDKRRWFMPCPRCARYHEWLFSGIKGFKDAPGSDKWERANYVKLNEPAFYECPLCRKSCNDVERQAASRAGRWVSGRMDGGSEGGKWEPVQTVTESGNVIGPRVKSERVGVYVWGIAAPWVSLSKLAGEFIEAEGDPELTRGFRNGRLALPHHEISKSTRPSVVRDKKAIAGPSLVVPRWATSIFTTVDVQEDWVRYVIRAWGGGYKSQGIFDGYIYESSAPVKPEERRDWVWNELVKVGLDVRFGVEGGGVAAPQAMLVDSGDGNRTSGIYEFCGRDARILPTKGMSKRSTKLFYDTEPKPGVVLWMIDTEQFKSALHALVHDPDQTKWLPHRDVNEQYCMEMSSESLQKDKGRWHWGLNGTARNETWDCEVLQRAAAEMFNAATSPTIEQQLRPPLPAQHSPPHQSFVTQHREMY